MKTKQNNEKSESTLKRKNINSNHLKIDNVEEEKVSFCKNCGYQLFDDELECPNCHKKRTTKK